ncbi:MAG: alpha/beta hydrolase [Acidobacteriota bacterium]|nr:alpha/beta hydrolase [Acidobacteriota bacterium]
MNNDYENKFDFGYAQIGGVRLHYAKAGEGERLVILLHGFPECWYSWRHQLAALSDEYTVVAPDLRGYNLSEKPTKVSDYDIEKLADDVIGLIHHFGREQAAVIGHDWGAGIMWSLAANHPEYLWKAGSLQVPPASVMRKNFSLRQLLASWYMFFFQLPFLPEKLLKARDFALLENALKNTTVENGVFTDEDIAVYKKAWNEPFALTAMINYYRANVPKRFFYKPETDSKIKVPTVFIYGEQDQALLPETVRGIGEVMDAPFEEFHIPTSAHWVQQEAADAVTEILREFLAAPAQ